MPPRRLLGSIFLGMLCLAATLVFLIGCMSPPTRDLAIYRVDVKQLAEELLKLGSNSTRKASDLGHPQLPNYWYFGTSGICDFFTDSARISATGQTRCRHAFPPNQDVLSVVQGSLGSRPDAPGEGDQEAVAAVISAWAAVLEDVPPSKLRDKEAKVASQNRASAALAILSMLVDLGSFGLAPFVKTRVTRLAVCFASFCSLALAIAAGVCAVLSMNEGMHGIVSGVGNVSGSLLFLFIGSLLKVPTVLGLSWRPKPLKLTHQQIGDLGERFMYEWCQSRLPDFTAKYWSSKAHPHEQGKYADFTYPDYDEDMLRALQESGVPVMPGWSRGTTYHLEVKSTQQECDGAPFFVSPNQISKMEMYDNDPEHAYIIARVFRVGTEKTAVRFFPRPWDLKHRGVLVFGIPNNNGDTPVFIQS